MILEWLSKKKHHWALQVDDCIKPYNSLEQLSHFIYTNQNILVFSLLRIEISMRFAHCWDSAKCSLFLISPNKKNKCHLWMKPQQHNQNYTTAKSVLMEFEWARVCWNDSDIESEVVRQLQRYGDDMYNHSTFQINTIQSLETFL